MQKTTEHLPEIKLMGLTTRTKNAYEMSALTAKIGPAVQKFVQENLSNAILHRKNPGTIYSVFTDYESDFTGEYTYLIGEEVTSFEGLPEGLTLLTIPPQQYIKFTNGPGPMPEVCLDVWKRVWSETAQELGGLRAYRADFEVYEGMEDPQNQIVKVYIGIKS